MLNRALIYLRGTDEEIETQLTLAYQVCKRRDYEVAAVLRDQPDGTESWHAASRMVRHHQADRIILASSLAVPDLLESATGSLPGPRRRAGGGGVHRATRRRRIRPVDRPGAGA
jgi:hypothetical protein